MVFLVYVCVIFQPPNIMIPGISRWRSLELHVTIKEKEYIYIKYLLIYLFVCLIDAHDR